MIDFCLLYTSDAADERSSVDLGGRRIIKKKTYEVIRVYLAIRQQNIVLTERDTEKNDKLQRRQT